MIRAGVILLALTSPAAANSLQAARDWAHCLLYPSHERCHATIPLPAPRPPEAPAAPVEAPAPLPPPLPPVVAPLPQAPAAAPPVAAPAATVQPVRPKPVKAKPRVKTKAVPQKPKAKRKHVVMPPWWNCAKTRARVAGKTEAELKIMQAAAQLAGYTLTKEQEGVAKACLGFS